MLLKFVKSLFAAKSAAGTIDPKEKESASLQQGIALQVQGRTDAAERVLRRLLDEQPDNADAAHLLGVLLLNSNRCGEAIAMLERAVALQPTQTEAALHLGSAYQSAGRLVEAERVFRDAITRSPSLIAAHVSLGILLKQRGQLDAACAAFEAALALQPDSAETWHNLRNLQRDLGDTSGARSSFERALQIAPDFLEVRFSRSMTLLASGEFETGWPEYETRRQLQRPVAYGPPRDLLKWDGAPAEDAVLVYGEQGIRDEIMFASCLPDLIRRCPRVVLICSGKLRSLFQSSFPATKVLARTSSRNQPAAAGARQTLAIGSLPQHFRRGRADFPQHRGYTRADPLLTQEYRERVAASGSELIVGISWRGGDRGKFLSSVSTQSDEASNRTSIARFFTNGGVPVCDV